MAWYTHVRAYLQDHPCTCNHRPCDTDTMRYRDWVPPEAHLEMMSPCMATALVRFIVSEDNLTTYTYDAWWPVTHYLQRYPHRWMASDTIVHSLVRLLETGSDGVMLHIMALFAQLVYNMTTREVTPWGAALVDKGVLRSLMVLLGHESDAIIMASLKLLVCFYEFDCDIVTEHATLGYLKALLTKPTQEMRRHGLVWLSWLTAGSPRVAPQLLDANFMPLLLTMLPDRYEGVLWCTINRLLDAKDGLECFLANKGVDLLMDALRPTGAWITQHPILATRKVARHAPSQRTLVAAGVPKWLHAKALMASSPAQTRFAIALALVHLALPAADATADLILTQLDPSMDLAVHYHSLANIGALLSGSSSGHYCALWWLLHLLWAERLGHYKRRNYARMAVNEQLVPYIIQHVRGFRVDTQDLAMRILGELTELPTMIPVIVEHGGLDAALECRRLTGVRYTVIDNLMGGAAGCIVSYDTSTLRNICEWTLIAHMDDANLVALLEYALASHAWMLQWHCLARLAHIDHEQLAIQWAPLRDSAYAWDIQTQIAIARKHRGESYF
jgi:hypothetical protein